MMQKTIVYCKSIKDCGRLYTLFKQKLGDASFQDGVKTSQSMLFGMYHHATPPRLQTRIMDSLYEDGPCRLVFATNALGMGVNFKDVRMIVHYGPPREMEELVQQIGRAGRDGKPANALVLFQGVHLRNCKDSVKEFCNNDSGCLRKMLLEEFGVNETSLQIKHECCSQCLCKDS